MTEIRAFGPLEIRGPDGQPLDALLAQTKRVALLVYLALSSRNGFVRRDAVLGMFWSEHTEDRARGSLRQALYALRQDLGDAAIVTRGDDEIGVNLHAISFDAITFDVAVTEGRLPDAADIYAGPLLSGFSLKGNTQFEQWLDGERERLARRYGRALEELADEASRVGDMNMVVQWTRRLAAHDPYSTRVALRYMKVLEATGDRAAALSYAERHGQRLQRDLDAAPSPDIVRYAAMLRDEPEGRAVAATHIKDNSPGLTTDSLSLLNEALSDRYVVHRRVGKGGMATVYLAEDVRHHRMVAVKVLFRELAAVIGAARFLNEIEVTARLQHPNIVPLYDSGKVGPFLYFVMPFVEGESLRDKLRREKQLSLTETTAILKAVAAALDYAHKHGVIHRDLKPENILLQSGQALVADFGIALAVTAAAKNRITETGLSLGTPHYMSPEQVTGDRELDPRSDIYSLGAVAYEMLVGDPPHTGATVQAVLGKVIKDPPPRTRNTRDTIPQHVDAALTRALAKIPADRFATASLFAEAVAAPLLMDASAVPRAINVRTRISVPRWAVALAVVAIVLLGALSMRWLTRSEAVSSGSASRWIVSTAPPQQLVPPDRPTQRVRIRLSPDGSHLVYVGGSSTDRMLFVRRLDDTEIVPIPGTEGAYSAFFHPDGEWIAFPVSSSGGIHQLKKVRLSDGGPATTIAQLPGGSLPYLEGGIWGRHDTIIFGWHSGGLYQVPAAGGALETLTLPSDDEQHVWPFFLPGERALLFTAITGDFYGPDQSVWALDLESGNRDSLVTGRDARYVAATGDLIYSRIDGVLTVVPFDVKRLELDGDPVAILDDIERDLRHGDFTISDNGTLAYISSGQHQREQLVQVNRQGLTGSLTELRASFYFPRFSHDGRRIAVNAWWENMAEMSSDIHVFDATSGLLRITFGHRTSPPAAWSPNDDTIAYADRQIFWVSARGGAQSGTLFDGVVPVNRYYWSLDWSRDGRYVAFADGEDILYLIVDGDRTPRRLDLPGRQSQVMFSPDARYVAYVSSESGRNEVMVRRFPWDLEAGTWAITHRGGVEPVWGRDGTELFFWREDRLMVTAVSTVGTFTFGAPRVVLEGENYKRWPGFANYDIHPDGDRFVMIQNPPSTDIVVVLNWLDELNAIKER